MDIEGEYTIDAPPVEVWEKLNELSILEKCIPGCESMEEIGTDEFACVVVAKLGPVKAKFKSTVTLSNINAPHSYTLSGKGNGGAAGFGQGSADVSLVPEGTGTRLKYEAKVSTGGKIAQVGARLMSSTTKKLADQFFTNFSACFAPDADSTDT